MLVDKRHELVLRTLVAAAERFQQTGDYSTTFHYDAEGRLAWARQHNVAKFDHYDASTGEHTSKDNWTITLTADYAANATTVTGAFFKTNRTGSGGPVIRDVGRIVFDQAVDDVFALDALWSAGDLAVIDSSGPHEYFDMTIVFPQMYCEADGGD